MKWQSAYFNVSFYSHAFCLKKNASLHSVGGSSSEFSRILLSPRNDTLSYKTYETSSFCGRKGGKLSLMRFGALNEVLSESSQ